MSGRILGSIPSFVFNNQHLIGLPKKWNIDSNKPITLEVKINEKNQLVLSSLCLVRQDKTNVSIFGETDETENAS